MCSRFRRVYGFAWGHGRLNRPSQRSESKVTQGIQSSRSQYDGPTLTLEVLGITEDAVSNKLFKCIRSSQYKYISNLAQKHVCTHNAEKALHMYSYPKFYKFVSDIFSTAVCRAVGVEEERKLAVFSVLVEEVRKPLSLLYAAFLWCCIWCAQGFDPLSALAVGSVYYYYCYNF